MRALPIDPLLPEIVRALRHERAVVIAAEPGAGKTTRVPRALLEAGLAGEREVLVLEPRRLAARLAARFVAHELGEEVGARVGYQVRFEEAAGPDTRLRFVSEGLLARFLLDDPTLSRAGVVVFDEFHERHLAGDTALALLRHGQERRPELKLLVMSATLAGDEVAGFLGGVVLRAPGREFEVAVEHLPKPDARPLGQQVAAAVRRLVREGLDGDVLVFLPGMAEIREAQAACVEVAAAAGLLVTPLHGELPAAEQDRAVCPQARPKLILSTNVAETSITIDGVTAVIDSGLARVAGHNPWSGLPTLRVRPVSHASAIQRAGRAGRTAPGRALRLFTEHDFTTRPRFDTPEVCRLDLAETVLWLAALGETVERIAWLEAPPPEHVASARELLQALGALTDAGEITRLGRHLARLPVHPRQARVALYAAEAGAAKAGALYAAILGERDLRSERGPARVSGASDLAALSDLFGEAKRRRFAAGPLRGLGIHAGVARNVERAATQLARLLGDAAGSSLGEPEETVLGKAILAGYPDRVAARVATSRGARPELLMSGGGRARLSDASVVQDAPLLVAVDAEEPGRGQHLPLVRLAQAIEEEWLLEVCPERLQDSVTLEWNDKLARVEEVSQLSYGALSLHVTRKKAEPSAEAARLLLSAALAKGQEAFADGRHLAAINARLAFLRAAGHEVPLLDGERLTATLRDACASAVTFAELRDANLTHLLVASLPSHAHALLEEQAPASITLPSGRRLEVHYDHAAAPWVESYLQDFFGMAQTPRLVQGRVALTVRLLAPSRRPVQVTSDLAGFWQRHYPELRRELSRRYPKHAWPDHPLTAKPPQRHR